ncbi:MAG: PEP-CTERM sorting domain-containing protein [Acidobacteriaceae bacterium]|nr:PEP-CTERM sorting domain-containing protein [Acidobacteriaceae bacterium]
MKTILLLLCSIFAVTYVASADPILVIGRPGDSYLSTPSRPSPKMSVLENFDSLTPFASFPSYSSPAVTITSPDGFIVLPYSTQSGPNELFDNSSTGTANITIRLTSGTTGIGLGIADSDPVSITLQALNSSGVGFGQAFSINLAATEDSSNFGNGYYALFDTTNDIFGLRILQTTGNPNYSGLAIDDLQVTPEPVTLALLGAGCFVVAILGRRKRV